MYLEKAVSVFLIAAIAIPATTVFAQIITPEAQTSFPPTFDVAAIRPMKYADGARTHITNPPRSSEFKAVNVTLRALLEVAYSIPETQMLSGPSWTSTDKFDLEARADAKFDEQLAALTIERGKQEKRRMLQALLADRFRLATHAEKREMPMFAMVNAKGGPKLVETNETGTGLSGGRGRIRIEGGADSLAVLAFELAWRLGRPVIDQTGLKGRYKLQLNWNDDDGASPDPNAPSLFTAIQEQLGLKLEATKGLVPILVIDHAEKPSEN